MYFLELASLFGYKYDDAFFDYLKSISIQNTATCGKLIEENDGGWKCKDWNYKIHHYIALIVL